jgi:hypothetical protein
MSLRQGLFTATLAGLLLLPAPDRLAACAFHTTLPEASLTEDIAGSLEVIAARPSADDPFRFVPVAVLRGEASGESPPHIVDSVTRARLLRNPDEAVLFARTGDGTWIRLLTLDAATRPLVDLMVARAEVWGTPAGAEERRDALAGYLAHPDARLRRISLRELDALPYHVLRRGTYPVEAGELLRGIADIEEMPFAPIRILLLGLAGGDTAREAIAHRLETMVNLGIDTNLGPWITAAVESGGAAGIADVDRLLTGASRMTEPQLVEIVRAFAVLSAEGDPALRGALDGAIRRLASRHPTAAPHIARAFGAYADYSQTELVKELVASRAVSDIAGLMVAAAYIHGARTSQEGTGASTGRAPVSTSR